MTARLDRTNAPHHVYRCYEQSGRLIYVGSTADLFGRIATHRASSWWAPTVTKVRAWYFPSGTLAREVERRAIRDEVPRWNKAGKWAGRSNWTREDWHDWLVTLLRDGMSSQLAASIKDYESLFLSPVPTDIAVLVEQAREVQRARDIECRERDARRAREHASRETAELRELNDELHAALARQEALARALGIDWDDENMIDGTAAIDVALEERRR